MFKDDENASPRSFRVSKETRQSQSASQDATDSGIIFYGMVEENAVGCWNTHLPFKAQNLEVVAKVQYVFYDLVCCVNGFHVI